MPRIDEENDEKSIAVPYEELAAEEVASSETVAPTDHRFDLSVFGKQLKNSLQATYAIVTPFLIANAVRRFWEIQPHLLREIQSIKYYTCNLPPEVITAISYDAATVSTEAFAISTPVIMIELAEALAFTVYQLARHVCQSRTLSSATENSFVNYIAWYQEQISYYVMPAAFIALIPGLVVMGRDVASVADKLHCDLFGSFFLGKCPQLYDLLTTEIYAWMTASAALLGIPAIGTLGRLITQPFKNLRESIHNMHQSYQKWYDDEKKWRIQKLVWEMLSLPALPAIVGIAAYNSIPTSNQYAEGAGCVSLWSILHSVFTNDLTSNPLCTAAEMGIAISGLIGDLEVRELYVLFVLLKIVSYLIGYLTEKNISRLQEPAWIAWMDHLLEKFKKIYDSSKMVSGFSLALFGPVIFMYAKLLAEKVLHEPLEVRYSLDNLPSFNTTAYWNNTSIDDIKQQVCPFDTIDLRNFTFHWVENIPVRLINNNRTLAVTLADACPQYDIFSLFGNNFMQNLKKCSAMLVARTIGNFVGTFWSGVSTVSAVSYLVSKVAFAIKILPERPNVSRSSPQPSAHSTPGCLSRAYHRFFKSAPKQASEPEGPELTRLSPATSSR